MKKLLYISLLLSLLTACKENNKEKFALLVQEWQGKEIVFPQNMAFTRFVTKPVDYRIPDAEYKVLVYVDSVGCTSCKLQLPKWKELIAHVDSATNGNVPFIFVFQSKDDRELRYILKCDNFDRLSVSTGTIGSTRRTDFHRISPSRHSCLTRTTR